MNNLTDKLLLKIPYPVSILECRSGWRVVINKAGKYINLAYSTYCDDNYDKMLETAIDNYKNKIDVYGKKFESRSL